MKIADPVLYLYASFDRHLPGHVRTDPRQLPLRLFRRHQRTWELAYPDPRWQVTRVRNLNLERVDRAEGELVPWIRRGDRPWDQRVQGPQPPRRQAALYTFGDGLHFYLMDSLGSTSTTFAAAWDRLAACPRDLLGTAHWAEAVPGFFGLNVVCSVLVDDDDPSPSDEEVREALMGIPARGASRIDTRIGTLWAVDSGWLSLPVPAPLVATWVLVTPASLERQALAALQLRPAGAPMMSRLLAARQKFWWQLLRYEEGKQRIRRARASLEKRVEWMITAQRDFEEASRVTDSEEMEELRFKSARAHTDLAALEAEVVRIRDAKTTLEINLGNYRAFTDDLRLPEGEDRVVAGELPRMEANVEQVERDADYHQGALDRARAALSSADSGFNISQDRQEARQVRLGVVQVSGLFASLMALIVTEAVRLGDMARDRPWFAAKIILLVLAGTFALAQVLQAWRSVRTALTSSAVGLTAGIVVLLLLDRDAGVWWHYLLGALAAAVAFGGTRLLEEKRRRDAEPAWRKIRDTRRVVEKLRRANEEISDLLDDLPTTRLHRLKDDYSFMEKIRRKRAEGRGEYSEIDVADSIGIRYVVSPFRLPVVVDRVERILDRRATEIEYKRGSYKAVHMEVDVLGVGARKDLNLMAEVQVKTHLQHMYATLVHDVLYKDVPTSGGPWWLRIVKGILRILKPLPPTRWAADQLLALPARVEMLIFRRWMRWPRRGEETVRLPRWRVREIRAEREAEVRRIVEDLLAAGNGTVRLVRIRP